MQCVHSATDGTKDDMPTPRSIFAVLALCAGVAAHAGETYIFKDEHGVQVISNAIPPHLARNGYKVVDSATMRTIRVVPPESADAAASASAASEAPEGRTRQRSDEQILALYSSIDELQSARNRKLRDLDVEIGRVEAQIESDTAQREKLAAQAADWERSAIKGTSALRESILKLDQRIAQHEQDLEKRRRERESEERNFAYEIQRMECLSRIRSGPECSAP
jgi:hypothetical protein